MASPANPLTVNLSEAEYDRLAGLTIGMPGDLSWVATAYLLVAPRAG